MPPVLVAQRVVILEGSESRIPADDVAALSILCWPALVVELLGERPDALLHADVRRPYAVHLGPHVLGLEDFEDQVRALCVPVAAAVAHAAAEGQARVAHAHRSFTKV